MQHTQLSWDGTNGKTKAQAWGSEVCDTFLAITFIPKKLSVLDSAVHISDAIRQHSFNERAQSLMDLETIMGCTKQNRKESPELFSFTTKQD